MDHNEPGRPIEILLVEDNPGDARLTREVFLEGKVRNHLNIVDDGVKALAYMRCLGEYKNAARPDLVLLDLNLPKKDGREVLAEIKADPKLKQISVIILTASPAEENILKAYNLNVNCYLTKPEDRDAFREAVRTIDDFWISVVKLPVN